MADWCYPRVVYVYNKKTGKKVYEPSVRMFLGNTGQSNIAALPAPQCTGTNLLRR